jgi:hypothetical protein
VVLIGERTAGRKWINYEIENSWDQGKGLVGIHVHNLKDSHAQQSAEGANRFDIFTVGNDHRLRSSIVPAYNPPCWDSKSVYECTGSILACWIDEVIPIRIPNGGAS